MQFTRRHLPRLDDLSQLPSLRGWTRRLRPSTVVSRVRAALGDLRDEARTVTVERRLPDFVGLAERVSRRLTSAANDSPSSAINAGGTVLGDRSLSLPLADDAVVAMAAAVSEFTWHAGGADTVESELARFTSASRARLAQSFGGAAVWALRALAQGREVVLARNQAFETRRGERLSDLIVQAGARLVEAGAVNSVSEKDYARAITDRTAAVLWAPPSSYAMSAAGRGAPLAALVEAAQATSVPLVALLDLAALDLAAVSGIDVPSVGATLAAGADVVVVSGDGLLGGPRSGWIVGRGEPMAMIAADALAGVFPADAPTCAAWSATLRLFREPMTTAQAIPALRLLNTPIENLRLRAERLVDQLRGHSGVESVQPVATTAYLTAAQAPGHRLASWGVSIRPGRGTAATLATRLFKATPRVVCRTCDETLIFDLRGVLPRQDQPLLAAILAALDA
ncbi:MAG TPA: hypothetical protein VHZ24_02975 [Pirellulales bacterium]|nr:hypothetical protein [Pirellulales bacterium]